MPNGLWVLHLKLEPKFATFDYGAATVTKAQVGPFCSGQFTNDAHNIILVGGTGTGKTHISIALGTNRSISASGFGSITPSI